MPSPNQTSNTFTPSDQMNVDFNFRGKTVVVSGGSRGIGAQICRDFQHAGASVIYLSRNSSSSLDGVQHISCDLRQEDQVAIAFDSIKSIDFLINVAAINYCKRIDNISVDEWDDVIAVNLRSYYLTSKFAIEKMKLAGTGKIVNISSIAGRNKSIVSGIHYTASKAAIIGLTRQLSHEVIEYGIQVNAVCPSQTMTDMLTESMTSEELRSLCERIPIGRLANVKEQSMPVLFLCSDAASYITGCVLDINGGQL